MPDRPPSPLQPDAAHRRRAALSVLEPLLGHEGAVQALVRFHDRLRSASVGDVIAFVDAVCTSTQTGDAARRQLYASLHGALNGSPDALPADPWPAMQARLPSTPTQVSASRWPAATASADEQRAQAPQRVFGAVVRAVVQQLHDRHAAHWVAFRQAAMAQFERAHVSPLAREGARAAWHETDLRGWQVSGQPDELRELVQRTYVALCDTLGPMDADDILAGAMRQAMQIPEAGAYAPGRLL